MATLQPPPTRTELLGRDRVTGRFTAYASEVFVKWLGDLYQVTAEAVSGLAALMGSSAYTVTNVTTDRTYDADATTVDELGDVLGTLIADLKSKGILS